MTPAEKKIAGFCVRLRLSCTWQPLRYNGRRAVIKTLDRVRHDVILSEARRLKDISVSDWTCNAGGVWEGEIYLQDATEAERLQDILAAEKARNENWWTVYHSCLAAGLDSCTAQARAETLYPTPETL